MKITFSSRGSIDFTDSLVSDLSFNPHSHNTLSPILDSTLSRDQGTQCEDSPSFEDATISYFPLFPHHQDHHSDLRYHKRSVSVRKERKPPKTRDIGTTEGKKMGGFAIVRGDKAGGVLGEKQTVSPLDRLLGITVVDRSPKKGLTEEKLVGLLNDYLPLRIGVDSQHKHFRLQSWRKEARDSPTRQYGSPASFNSNPLNSLNSCSPSIYSRKKRVYFKPKPSKDLTEEAQEYIRQRKAFLKLKGRRQLIIPATPSPQRQRCRSP